MASGSFPNKSPQCPLGVGNDTVNCNPYSAAPCSPLVLSPNTPGATDGAGLGPCGTP